MSVLIAIAIHALTASGVVLGLFALLAVERGQFTLSFVWLGAALIVDGIDGPLARWAGVKRTLPLIDGDTLDLVVDYLTYVLVPAFLIYRAALLPDALALVGVAAILLSSLYTFARTDMKTEDNFFRGFPALWNVVAYYLYALRPSPALGAVFVALLAVLTFVPIHVVHPLRVRRWQPWLGLLTAAWGLASLALLAPGLSPPLFQFVKVVSLVSATLLIALGLLRTALGPLPSQTS